jgi:hypothetical protein
MGRILSGRAARGKTGYAVSMPDRASAERAILDLLEARAPGRTICPSEAARVLGGDDGFREHMPLVRKAAAALRDRGLVEVTQRGEPVDPASARGPIRLRSASARRS